MTAVLGYARVSTTRQDLDAQLSALTAAGVNVGRVFTDTLSGSANTARPGLAAMLDYARADDIVVVTAIDRLGRSVVEVTRTIAELCERRILLRALREGIDTATSTGRTVAAIMATLAELELELGRECRAAARESRRGRQLPATKPPKLTADRQEQLRRLAADGRASPGTGRSVRNRASNRLSLFCRSASRLNRPSAVYGTGLPAPPSPKRHRLKKQAFLPAWLAAWDTRSAWGKAAEPHMGNLARSVVRQGLYGLHS